MKDTEFAWLISASTRVVPFPATVISILLALVSMQIQWQVVPLQTHKFRVWPRLSYLIVWRHVVTPSYGKRTRKAFACLTYLDRYARAHVHIRMRIRIEEERSFNASIPSDRAHFTCRIAPYVPVWCEVVSMPGIYRAAVLPTAIWNPVCRI